MENVGIYRHELKYKITYSDYLAIRSRIRTVMKSDCHTNLDGCYTIRSIYFDNADDKALREKIIGIQKREKWRIRYYNDDLSFITLEKKQKSNSLCMKFHTPITENECRSILNGETSWMLKHPSSLVSELYCKMNIQQLRPRVTVSYLREPYIYHFGNVRVTFDSKIRTSLFSRDFFDNTKGNIIATDNDSDIIMEVKYDSYLPEIIQHLLQTENIRLNAFSKYGTCRRFG